MGAAGRECVDAPLRPPHSRTQKNDSPSHDIGREYKEYKYRWGPTRRKQVTTRAGSHLGGLPAMRKRMDTVEGSLIHLA